MFLGRTEEARAIYLQYRGKTNVVGEKPWDTTVLDDFAELRQAGLNHPLMEEIAGLFGEDAPGQQRKHRTSRAITSRSGCPLMALSGHSFRR